jgi:hypothetical protein
VTGSGAPLPFARSKASVTSLTAWMLVNQPAWSGSKKTSMRLRRPAGIIADSRRVAAKVASSTPAEVVADAAREIAAGLLA